MDINPLRFKGYYLDSETGFYYLCSRYYDPETCRFINADNYASTGQDILGLNMFVYCGNDPVRMNDADGHEEVSDLNNWGCYIPIACLGISTSYPVFQAIGPYIGKSLDDFRAFVDSEILSNVRKGDGNIYTVYFLPDDTGNIFYVGRVKTAGFDARMEYHRKTKKNFKGDPYRIRGLTYEEARGLEEIGMVMCHTLRAAFLGEIYYGNKIHGVSRYAEKATLYIKCALDYYDNHEEQGYLNDIKWGE